MRGVVVIIEHVGEEDGSWIAMVVTFSSSSLELSIDESHSVYTKIWKKSRRDSKAPKIMSSRN